MHARGTKRYQYTMKRVRLMHIQQINYLMSLAIWIMVLMASTGPTINPHQVINLTVLTFTLQSNSIGAAGLYL